VSVLQPAFEATGAKSISVDAGRKFEYHAGAVFVSKFVVTIIDAAQQLFENAGIDKHMGQEAIRSLAKGCVDHALDLGTSEALTDPVARGGYEVIQNHLSSIQDKDLLSLYLKLSGAAVSVARRKNSGNLEALDEIAKLLRANETTA